MIDCVADLIRELTKMPLDAKVYCDGQDGAIETIRFIEREGPVILVAGR